MNNALFRFRRPENEHSMSYAPGCPERALLREAIKQIESETAEIPLVIGGEEVYTGDTGRVVMPHDHAHTLAVYHKAGAKEMERAIKAATAAHERWAATPWTERAAISLKIAELIDKKYRYLLNAATMLGQSKTVWQAEIEAASETIDYFRFTVHCMDELYGDQPASEEGVINSLEYRPLEGFVYAVTPFNFTAIAANLPMAPVIMGNTVVWKPATTSLLSSWYLMKIFMEAGVPAGVLNFMPGPGSVGSRVVLNHKELAGIHFTGSTQVFNSLWRGVAENLNKYVSYPRLVGETGGKDFLVMHRSADAKAVAAALMRGAFEYQGQKCSATSRAYIPASRWDELNAELGAILAETRTGDPRDFRNFVCAVIDEASFDNCMDYINYAKNSPDAEILYGGAGDKTVGYFVQPTVIKTTDPHFRSMEEEIFGPILTVYVYDDARWTETLRLCDETSPYGLTGSVFAADRAAIEEAKNLLRYAAGNFYINDKTTAASVGLQPFGGSRASGTNDKAGTRLNLSRWVSPRTIKENLLPPRDFKYPYMMED
ncbi:L-glutamate gamma-semialdehyde dehydrogenase [uncultured Cloacibacillus sp.]|uniref:L-glutamate gamma-semialdehyde dehydrogenase n=1 Tax=uncultured Cloacibacillus sp. TaxID=889794 RepID=UPI0025EE7B95|nr:L-glutamate gamma-semialdehyde dehydrogenase [uncultured Cloacibacillus sp.]